MTTRSLTNMPRTVYARIAGLTFLLYFAFGIPSLFLFDEATNGEGIAARLVSLSQHTSDLRIFILLTLLSAFTALVLGGALYAITRDVDHDVALMALTFRFGEGLLSGIAVQRSLSLLWLVTATGPNAPDAETARTIGAFLLSDQGVGALFFAVGSLLFSWLLLRGRIIPVPLAWLGVLASVLWAVGLPLRLIDVLPNSAIWFIYLPMAAFEIPLALWLLVKGAAMPAVLNKEKPNRSKFGGSCGTV